MSIDRTTLTKRFPSLAQPLTFTSLAELRTRIVEDLALIDSCYAELRSERLAELRAEIAALEAETSSPKKSPSGRQQRAAAAADPQPRTYPRRRCPVCRKALAASSARLHLNGVQRCAGAATPWAEWDASVSTQ